MATAAATVTQEQYQCSVFVQLRMLLSPSYADCSDCSRTDFFPPENKHKGVKFVCQIERLKKNSLKIFVLYKTCAFDTFMTLRYK